MIGVDTNFLVYLEIAEMAEHARAHEVLQRDVLSCGETLALAPQVLAEFVHVITDPRRFERPLTVDQARDKARFWWLAAEVQHVYPTFESTVLFLDWHRRYGLGRKRLLDTQLATTLWSAGVRRIITGNASDFRTFPGFSIVTP
jgi:predicted nucleic acid-binding protein